MKIKVTLNDLSETFIASPFVDLPQLKEWGDGKWREQAECANSDTEKFFPRRGGDSNLIVAQALLTCAPCTVRKECLEFALVNNIKHGIWGGVTTDNRRRLQIENAEEASKLRATTLLKNLRKLKVETPVQEAAKIMNLNVEKIRELLAQNK